MLSRYLQNALNDLKDLIAFSEKDIEDIIEAKHDPQFERMALKDEKLKSFEQKKAMIDHEISKLMTSNPQTPLPELLNDEQHNQLDELKVELSRLREVNQRYAKLVVGVSAFYNSLLERVVPTEMQGYNKVASKEASFLKVRA
jgi:predicted nuclease with TOPRIM domain